jgi:hypothetical protein
MTDLRSLPGDPKVNLLTGIEGSLINHFRCNIFQVFYGFYNQLAIIFITVFFVHLTGIRTIALTIGFVKIDLCAQLN